AFAERQSPVGEMSSCSTSTTSSRAQSPVTQGDDVIIESEVNADEIARFLAPTPQRTENIEVHVASTSREVVVTSAPVQPTTPRFTVTFPVTLSAPEPQPSSSSPKCHPATYASSMSHQPRPSTSKVSAPGPSGSPVAKPPPVKGPKFDRHGQLIVPLNNR